MTKDDKSEIKEMLTGVIDHMKELHNMQYDHFDEKLNSIIIQTTKTNGKVMRHTEQIATLQDNAVHTIVSCPQNLIIQELRDKNITGKRMWGIVIGAGVIVGIVVGLIDIIIRIL